MNARLEERTVAEVMTGSLLTVPADETVLMAWELMRRGDYHHLPVVTEDGRFIGLLEARTVAARWRGGGPEANRRPVTDLLGRWRPTVQPDDTIEAAARIMLQERTDAVAVTRPDDQLVGLLTAQDLLAALAGRRPARPTGSANIPCLYRIEPVRPAVDHASTPHTRFAPD